MNEYRFLNPYNFVRYLPQNNDKDENRPDVKLLGHCSPPPHDRFIGLTGKITCELTGKTPLFISDSEFVEKFRNGHKSYRFFRLNDNGKEEYAIPSTSLRGMLRSVFEASTNSCFSVLEGGLLGKRDRPENYDTEKPLAGLIIRLPRKNSEKPGLVRKMKSCKLPHSNFAKYKNKLDYNGKKVFIKIDNGEVKEIKEDYTENDHSEEYIVGYLKTSGKGLPGRTQKRNEYVFVENSSSEDFELSYETYQNYIIANKNNKFPHTKMPKVGDTIWFRAQRKKIIEFGFAQVYRKPFRRSINDLLAESFRPCTSFSNLCPACRVFGWVDQTPREKAEESKKVSYAGRVKISHAKLIESNGKLEKFPLAILSTPKPTTTFFYLLKNGQPDFNVTYNSPEAQLRGRKFYRHQDEAKEQEYKRANEKKDEQNRTLRDALAPGAKFAFTVEFENLAPVELGALLWSIEMENGMFHKLGLAKPLGFGSVKINIQKIEIFNPRERYNSFSAEGWIPVNEKNKQEWIKAFKTAMKNKYGKDFDVLENIKDLKAILSSPELPVHYPRSSETPRPDGRNFKWFEEHKRLGKMPLELAAEDNKGFSIEFQS